MQTIVNWKDTTSNLEMILDIDVDGHWFLAPRSTFEADHCCEGLFSNNFVMTGSPRRWAVRCACGSTHYKACPIPGARYYVSEDAPPEPDMFESWYKFWFIGTPYGDVEVNIEWA